MAMTEIDDSPEMSECPKCHALQEDWDGFGVLYCPNCKFCTHSCINGGVCGLCGMVESEAGLMSNTNPKPCEILLRFVMPIETGRPYFRNLEETLEKVRQDYFADCTDTDSEVNGPAYCHECWHVTQQEEDDAAFKSAFDNDNWNVMVQLDNLTQEALGNRSYLAFCKRGWP
jgi:hypothetical protein